MPIRNNDPFHDHLARLRPEFNRYVELLRSAQDSQLPALQGPELRERAGSWRTYFHNRMGKEPQGLLLEIGSHLGEVILKVAADHPELACLGMDITLKRVVKLAQKGQSLPNLTSMLANARGLEALFADSELDGVILFFPDPWAKKKRQTKNRLADTDFLGLLRRKLKPGAFFWFKTDCEPYFSDVQAALQEAGWEHESSPKGLPSLSYTSRFERLFREQGLPTYAAVWTVPCSSSNLSH